MRLIDADALIEDLKYKRRTDREGKKYSGLECAISKVKKMPTINSKTVVAREIFAEIKQGLDELSNAHREKSNYSGVVHTIQARSIVIKLENKYTKGE